MNLSRLEPDFLLDRPAQVVSLCEGNPGKRHQVWQGKEDFSALRFLRMNGGLNELELYAAAPQSRLLSANPLPDAVEKQRRRPGKDLILLPD